MASGNFLGGAKNHSHDKHADTGGLAMGSAHGIGRTAAITGKQNAGLVFILSPSLETQAGMDFRRYRPWNAKGSDSSKEERASPA